MAIKKPIPITFNLDSHQSVQSVCAVIHIDDKNTETLDLSLMQGGEHIAVSPNSTVTARFVRVKDKILISDNVPCAVQENGNILIPIDNAAAKMLTGEIKIEVNIVDENDVLTMQFPLVIRVNNTILADAEISPESEGTIPELLEEAREAAESATQAAKAATEAISTKQDKLTAGENITIDEDNVISATGGVTSYNDLTDKPILQIQSASGTTENITIEDIVKFIPFYKNVWTGYINVDLSGCYKTNGTGTTSVTDFDSLLYNTYHNNSAKLYSVNSQGIPQSINAKNNLFVLYQFGVQNSYSSQLIFWVDSTTNEPKCAYRVCEYNHDTHRYNTPDFIEIGSGGAQIVSGVVNVNGTITFTDSEGNSFTTSGESVIGADGFSPVATVTQTASGATISITDSTGTTTANISNGAPGQDYVLTAQDKADIADIVLGELPTTEGVLYGNTSN